MRSLWHWRDLFVDHKTGKLRETAMWSNVGKGMLTAWLGVDIYRGTATVELGTLYASIVVLHEMGARFFNQRQQKIDKEPT